MKKTRLSLPPLAPLFSSFLIDMTAPCSRFPDPGDAKDPGSYRARAGKDLSRTGKKRPQGHAQEHAGRQAAYHQPEEPPPRRYRTIRAVVANNGPKEVKNVRVAFYLGKT